MCACAWVRRKKKKKGRGSVFMRKVDSGRQMRILVKRPVWFVLLSSVVCPQTTVVSSQLFFSLVSETDNTDDLDGNLRSCTREGKNTPTSNDSTVNFQVKKCVAPSACFAARIKPVCWWSTHRKCVRAVINRNDKSHWPLITSFDEARWHKKQGWLGTPFIPVYFVFRFTIKACPPYFFPQKETRMFKLSIPFRLMDRETQRQTDRETDRRHGGGGGCVYRFRFHPHQ